MSEISIASLRRISREGLAAQIRITPLSTAGPIAVVDVRDSDHAGGHILGSIHAPTPALDWKMPELVRQLRDKDAVVFHCALSQQRGPAAALRYMRERDRLLGETKARSESAEGQTGKGEGKEEEGKEGKAEKKQQKVYVLDGGFVEWQDKYGKDKGLTEGYVEDIWKYGY